MKKNKSTIILILVFFVGLSVMLYPTLSDYVNQLHQSRAVATYAEDVDNLTDADYSAYFDAADAFNAQVAANENALYRPDQLTGYNDTLDITGTGIMGYITISKIGVELPIYHGTSDGVLQIAAGHFNAMTYFVSMSVTLAGFLFYRRRRHGPTVVARFSRRGLNPVLLLWGVFFMLSTSVVLEPLLSLMPEVPNVYGRGAWAIVTVVVMAPLFEEVIFRGVLLESTRVRYGVVAAWLLSSAIFGIVHVHPTVVVNAFVMGLVLAFIYLRTDSLWSAIILHAINNGIAYLALIAGHGNSMLIDMVGSRTLYVLFYIAALAVFAVSGYMMLLALRRLKAEDKNRAAA